MSPAPISLSAAKARRLGAAVGPLMLVYGGVTALDVAVLMKVAEQPDIRPTDLADELGLTLTRAMNVLWSLENGRQDSDKKALGLIEIRANQTPGHRNTRMVRLTPKGEKVARAMLEALGG